MTYEDTFRTPHGREMRMLLREDTSDWNTVNAITAVGDEYHLPEGLQGWAVDVGSHIGACAIALLLDNPDVRVVAIEGLPENVWMLRENLVLNGVQDRCVVIGNAAGDGSPVRIGYGADGVHDYIGNASAPAGNREVTVPGVSLRFVLAEISARNLMRGIDANDAQEDIVWMKIDCEGCEVPFLADKSLGQNWIRRVRHIEGEVHPEAGGARLLSILEATHDVTFPGWEANPDFGPFTAVRR